MIIFNNNYNKKHTEPEWVHRGVQINSNYNKLNKTLFKTINRLYSTYSTWRASIVLYTPNVYTDYHMVNCSYKNKTHSNIAKTGSLMVELLNIIFMKTIYSSKKWNNNVKYNINNEYLLILFFM